MTLSAVQIITLCAGGSSLESPWRDIRTLIRTHKCNAAYLDVGSNVGVQIRKLYEPHLYAGKDPKMPALARKFELYEEPDDADREAGLVKGVAFWNVTAGVLPIFEQYFGPAPRCRVCAIGVEPNPRHAPRHAELQAAYRAAGVGALWLSETAADVSNGTLQLDLSKGGGSDVNDVGLSTEQQGRMLRKDQFVQVRTIDLAALIRFVDAELRVLQSPPLQPKSLFQQLLSLVAPGRPKDVGKAHHRGPIVMKIDTEGAEYRILPHLLSQSVACLVDLMFLEWHPVLEPKTGRPKPTTHQKHVRLNAQQTLQVCNTTISDIDDETFLYDGRPLPAPHSMCGAGHG